MDNFCDKFGVTYLQNETKLIENVLFIGCTLWTDFQNQNPIVMIDAQSLMSDYREIKDSGLSKNDIE